MDFISLPNKIKYTAVEGNVNKILLTVEPCQPGYGLTLGNALRRVLLSSTPGSAVDAIKIKGVDHEFSTLSGVKEDVIEIILKFKQIRLKIDGNEPVRLKLKVKGEKDVTAGDIQTQTGVEVLNKDLVLFTINKKSAEVEIEIMANKGIGYLPTETKDKRNYEVGFIILDSIYTPIKNVAIDIEKVRVGGMTNFDKLTLSIETDGTMDPKEAVKLASEILVKHFELFNGQDVNLDELENVPEIKE